MTNAMRVLLRELLGNLSGDSSFYSPPRNNGGVLVSKADMSAAYALVGIGVARIEEVNGERRLFAARDWIRNHS